MRTMLSAANGPVRTYAGVAIAAVKAHRTGYWRIAQHFRG
jgi:hypothetical protein